MRSPQHLLAVPSSLGRFAGNFASLGRIQEIHLPADVKFVSVEGGESADPGRKRFYFFPNGSSLGGEIVIAIGTQAELSALTALAAG